MGSFFTPAFLLTMTGLIPCVLLQFPELVSTLNDEGRALLRFREAVEVDTYGLLANWVEEDVDGDPPCSFFGVLCQDGRVVSLNLENLGLKGKLSPELHNLVYLRHLFLNDNNFYGTVPGEIGELRKLEILNLSYNNLHGSLPSFLQNPKSLPFITALEGNSFDTSLSTNIIYNINYHRRHRSLLEPERILSSSPSPSPSLSPPPPPPPPPPPSTTNPKTKDSHGNGMLGLWIGLGVSIGVLFLVFLIILVCFCKSGKGVDITPLAAVTLSDQLQHALVKGVPTLNYEEIRAACEDFSNEIGSLPDGTLFKGNLSSGAEIAVIVNKKDNGCWTQTCQEQFRSTIEIVSTVNHKNFVNLVGYSEEDEPFSRMMVFEYASNGLLYEHIHPNVGEREHLSWLERMRIVMGVGYFLLHISRLDPPHILQNLTSKTIFLTDDLAAKVSHLALLGPEKTELEKAKIVHMFGILMLELITAKNPCSSENDNMVKWAFDHLFNNEKSQVLMLDPTLTSFQIGNVGPVCEVIKSCLNPDPTNRPSIKDVVLQLNQITGISPINAFPRTSPLWWAELEIVSFSNHAMP